jgi:hypothetical protein
MPPYRLILRRYWKTLLGTAGTWALYDFVVFVSAKILCPS